MSKTARWTFIRHAPVIAKGLLYGASDVPADCSDQAAFAAELHCEFVLKLFTCQWEACAPPSIATTPRREAALCAGALPACGLVVLASDAANKPSTECRS